MKFVDSPISRLRGRTPRELVILGSLVLFIASDLAAPRPPWWDLSMFGIALIFFVTRFWAARILGLGICVSSLAMALVHVREGSWHLGGLLPHQLSFVATWLCGLAVLASPALGRNFERAPRWTPFGRSLLNPYASLPGLHLAAIAVGAISLGSLAHLLLRAIINAQHHGVAATSLVIPLVAIAITLLLLVAGRVLGLIAAAGVSVYMAIALGTKLCAAARYIVWSPSPCSPASDPLAYHPGVVHVGFALALIGAVATVPYALMAAKRLIQR